MSETTHYGRKVRVTIRIGKHTEVREGRVYRTLPGLDGSTVWEVDFGDGPQRLRTQDQVEFIKEMK